MRMSSNPGAGDTDVEQAALLRKVCSALGHLQRQCAFACTTEKNGGEFQAFCAVQRHQSNRSGGVILSPGPQDVRFFSESKRVQQGMHIPVKPSCSNQLLQRFAARKARVISPAFQKPVQETPARAH